MNPEFYSSSSSDDFFDDTMNSIILMNERLEEQEDYIVDNVVHMCIAPLVEATYERPQTQKKKRAYIHRDRENANQRLMKDYFIDRPLYPDSVFRRRFRMNRSVFHRIVETVTSINPFFQQRPDATGKLGASAIQKCTAALRMLAYGTSADTVDEYIKIAESTARSCLVHFVKAIRNAFTEVYLQRPSVTDVQRLLRDGERRGFPGMMGSIDCMHWEWKNCPKGWKELYQGRNKSATIILEAVASSDLWIWHAFFGTPGTCNDINVLRLSPVFDDIYRGIAPEVSYNVNGNTYKQGYYLTDGIYPKWAMFIPAIRLPLNPQDALFMRRQESVRKDVERAFGVLQARFAIIQRPALVWDQELMWEIMLACIILHNMIVEDERDKYQNYKDPTEFEEENIQHAGESSSSTRSFNVRAGRYNNLSMEQYMQRRENAWNRQVHNALQSDLVQHIWQHCQEWYDD